MILWVATLLGALGLLLAIPVHVSFVVRRREALSRRIYIGWMFGMIHVPLRPAKRRVSRRRRRRAGKRTTGHGRRLLAMLRSRDFLSRALRLLRDVMRRVEVRRCDVQMRFGLDDPADTGQLWAAVGPIMAVVPTPSAARFAVEPDFTAPAFNLDARGEIRVIPIALMAVFASFLLSPPTVRALRAAASAPP